MADLIYPDAGQWINALEAGQKAGMTDRRNAAASQAGGLMASGDYKGAAGALYGVGDFTDGSAIAKAGYDQANQAQKQARLTTVQQKLAGGDFAGAYAAAGTDKDILDGLDKVAAHAKDTTALLASAVQSLKGPDGRWLPPDEARAKYRSEIAPLLISQRQMDPNQINNFDPTPENLTAIQSQVLGLAKQIDMAKPDWHEAKRGDGSSDFVDLNPLNRRSPDPAATQVADVASPASLAGGGFKAGPASAGPIDPDALWAAIKHQESGGEAEPGKAVGPDTPYGHALGSTQMLPATAQAMATKLGMPWQPALLHSNTPEALAYQDRLGRAYLQEGLDKNNGDPAAAAAYYFGGPDQSLHGPKTAKYVEAVLRRANPQAYEVAANGATPAPPTPDDGIPRVAGSAPQTKWTPDGKGFLRSRDGDIKPDPSFEEANADPNLVKAIIEGRAPVPTAGRQASDPKWQAAMAAAMAQDPTLDGANYATRVKTRADFATGTAARTKTALNTALGHAGDLDGQVDALHNTPIRMINMVGNAVGNEVGDPRVKTFNLTKEALLHEAMKVFAGSAGSLQEFSQLAENLNVNDSPAQQHSVIRKLVGLLASKMDALAEQYRTGMGKDLEASQIMSPHAEAVFNKISGLPGGERAAQPQARAAAEPVHVSTPQEAMALAPGTVFITPDGRRKVR